ncbi:MAG: Ppx/GppA phosphatase family protein [Candidatus Thermoplasmatota archaeon]
MPTSSEQQTGKVVSFIDIGTNSIRLIIVRINPNQSYAILREEKESVRLGEKVFKTGYINQKTIDYAVLVVKKFVEAAKGFGSSEIHAVATSTAREAYNRLDFIQRLSSEANVDVRIISGKEEARLIYFGLSSGVHLQNNIAVFIDIGGGSTEIIIGDQKNFFDLESLGLGAIRLKDIFLSDSVEKPISEAVYNDMKRFVKKKMIRVIERVNPQLIQMAIGSSGTIINLAEITAKYHGHDIIKNNLTLNYKELKKTIQMLCTIPLNKRREVPGINPERADIIIPGAVILDCFMEDFNIKELIVSYRDLRHGMIIDYLERHEGYTHRTTLSVRESSVLQLAKLFNVNMTHARTVESIAIQLFEQTKKLRLHTYGDAELELLRYASVLHDIGNFISFRSHHLHSHYIINNAELLGFDQTEIEIMATIVRYHRKKLPKKKDFMMTQLSRKDQQLVSVLSFILRLAEKLDRSHAHLVRNVRLKQGKKDTLSLILSCVDGQCELERWSVSADCEAFEKIFGMPLEVLVE